MRLKWIIGFLYILTLGQLIKSGHFSLPNSKVPLSKTTAALTSKFFSDGTDHSGTSAVAPNTEPITRSKVNSSERAHLTSISSTPQ